MGSDERSLCFPAGDSTEEFARLARFSVVVNAKMASAEALGKGFPEMSLYAFYLAFDYVAAAYREVRKGYGSVVYDVGFGMEDLPGAEGSDGDSIAVADCPSTRDGYVFMGWNTQADGGGREYSVGSSYVLRAGKNVLYAQWEPVVDDGVRYRIEHYTVGADGGVSPYGDPVARMATIGAMVKAEPIAIPGYVYLEGYRSGSFAEVKIGAASADEELVLRLYYVANPDASYLGAADAALTVAYLQAAIAIGDYYNSRYEDIRSKYSDVDMSALEFSRRDGSGVINRLNRADEDCERVFESLRNTFIDSCSDDNIEDQIAYATIAPRNERREVSDTVDAWVSACERRYRVMCDVLPEFERERTKQESDLERRMERGSRLLDGFSLLKDIVETIRNFFYM